MTIRLRVVPVKIGQELAHRCDCFRTVARFKVSRRVQHTAPVIRVTALSIIVLYFGVIIFLYLCSYL